MKRGERRDRTERKATSRKRKLLNAIGAPRDEFRRFYAEGERFLDTEPEGKFRNNSIANEYASCGKSRKTNRKKGHANYRAKTGAYGAAMDWKPHDKAQLDAMNDDEKDIQKEE